MITEEEVAEIPYLFQKARSNVYLFLANAFLGNWELLRNAGIESINLENDPLHLIVEQIQKTPLEEIQIQYDNLFVAPGYYFVPPIASYHLNLKDDDLNQFLESLYETYIKRNYSAPYVNHERADHIGYLLLFVHFMIEAQLKDELGNEKKSEIQTSFIKEKLASWLPKLEVEVEKKLTKGLILDLVKYTNQFVSWDSTQS